MWALAPTVLLGLLFWYIMRIIVKSDRNERRAYAKLEAAERKRRGLPPRDPAKSPRTSAAEADEKAVEEPAANEAGASGR